MQGILFALDQVGQLAQAQADRIAELEAENTSLRQALGVREDAGNL